jgi:hypothetical protein
MPCSPGCEKAKFGKLMFMGGRLAQRIACVECLEYLNSDEKIGLEWGYPIKDIDRMEPFIHPFFIGYKMDNNWERYPDRYLSIHRGVDFHTHGDRAVLAVADGKIFRITADGVNMHHENGGECYTSYYMHVKGHQYLQGLTVEKGKEIGLIKQGDNHVHLEMYRTKVNRAAESSKLYQSGQDWFYGFLRQQDTDLLNPMELITP